MKAIVTISILLPALAILGAAQNAAAPKPWKAHSRAGRSTDSTHRHHATRPPTVSKSSAATYEDQKLNSLEHQTAQVQASTLRPSRPTPPPQPGKANSADHSVPINFSGKASNSPSTTSNPKSGSQVGAHPH